MPSKPKKIVIVFWEGYLSVSPSLLNAIELLAKENFEIDILLRKPLDDYAELSQLPDTAHIWMCNPISFKIDALLRLLKPKRKIQSSSSPSLSSAAPAHSKLRWLRDLKNEVTLSLDILQFLWLGVRHISKDDVSIIGIDLLGLSVSGLLARLFRLPLVYWSLELAYMQDMPTPLHKRLKQLERVYSARDARIVIIQDWSRAESLIGENGIDPAKICIVPNAPYGDAKIDDRHYFHRLFNLPATKLVVLHAGMIVPEVLSLEVAIAAAAWGDDKALVLHERMKRDSSDGYLQQITSAGHGNAYLSLAPVPFRQLDNLIASAAVGLVLYRNDLGPNFALMAGASGKMAYYLRCKIPVVCIDLPTIRAVVEKYQCGIVVSSVDQIESAVDTILQNYDFYQENALNCYYEVYEFEGHFQSVLSLLKTI